MINFDISAKIRARLPKVLKRRLRYLIFYPTHVLRLAINYRYDQRRFKKYSSVTGDLKRKTQILSWINADYHKIEKALALPYPKPGFGSAVVWRLIDNLERYFNDFEPDEVCAIALNVLTEYVAFNQNHCIQVQDLQHRIDMLAKAYSEEQQLACGGGTILVRREDIHRHAKIELKDFFNSRHSIRQFSDEPVDRSILVRAVHLAQKTPTVCNRQSLKAYIFDEPVQKTEVLQCQRGNRGFRHQIASVIVVTSDVQTFFSVGERNQCWIDGGLFSMSLVYALHSLGLGSICLNWSVEKEDDERLHRVAGIPESEAVIMMIGVGHLPVELRVAQSQRKPINEVLVWGKMPTHKTTIKLTS